MIVRLARHTQSWGAGLWEGQVELVGSSPYCKAQVELLRPQGSLRDAPKAFYLTR